MAINLRIKPLLEPSSGRFVVSNVKYWRLRFMLVQRDSPTIDYKLRFGSIEFRRFWMYTSVLPKIVKISVTGIK